MRLNVSKEESRQKFLHYICYSVSQHIEDNLVYEDIFISPEQKSWIDYALDNLVETLRTVMDDYEKKAQSKTQD